jgi:hypothetical protein
MFVNTAVPLSLGMVLPFTVHLPNAPGWAIRVEGEVLFSLLRRETNGRSPAWP